MRWHLNPHPRMNVDTIPEANEALTECGCCTMPLGTGPRVEYEIDPCEFTLSGQSPILSNQAQKNSQPYAKISWSGSFSGNVSGITYSGSYSYEYTLNQNNCAIITNGQGSQTITNYYDEAQNDIQAISSRSWTRSNGVYSGTETNTAYDENGDVESTDTIAFTPSPLPGELENWSVVTLGTLNNTATVATFTGVDNGIITNYPDINGPQTLTFSDPILERVRVGVPLNYSTGPLPKTFYKVTWDYVTALVTWWAWHDGGRNGSAPAGGVVLVTQEEWIWGGNMSTQFSEWYEIAIVENAAATETRVANMRYTHYQSNRFGSLAVETGPQVVTA